MHMSYSQREAQMNTPELKPSVESVTEKSNAGRPIARPETNRGSGSWLLSTLGTLVVLGAIGAYVLTEQQVVKNAAFTPLYDFTLQQAYSRFQESEKQVALNAPSDPIEAVANPQVAAQQYQGTQQNQSAQQYAAQQQAARQRAAQQQATAAATDDGGPYTQRGNELSRAGKYTEAIAAYQQALAENPQRITTRHSLADALRQAERYDEAIAVYRQVLQQNPQYYCCHIHIADVEKAQNHLEAAQAEYALAERGFSQQIEQGGPMATAAKYQLAAMYVSQGQNLAQAMAFAQELVTTQPTQAAYQQLLGQIFIKLGRVNEAIAVYDQLGASHPEYAAYCQQQIAGLRQASDMVGPPAPHHE